MELVKKNLISRLGLLGLFSFRACRVSLVIFLLFTLQSMMRVDGLWLENDEGLTIYTYI
jgi:hypothetical protein